ncbi:MULTISPECIES: alpha/beta hydrolase [unclassified Sinorhizobium]|uniref:alpha/beta fold hydrolase n=1 Tax=unclassified Sinorhizobium TaxID=2613772 RepID=UPI0024C3CC53|nr:MULTISPECIES: alpha/beta hydrolase [unclassified Sinorhizobium]MDK1374677.1 alpha/beta hydrolase [Sinorhizobium sp. 6-70]MDK1481141.1 alpha/beta hydrolase [Sinorhizobium sp. 6-117]
MNIVLVPGFMTDSELWSDMLPRLHISSQIVHVDPTRAQSIEEMARQALIDAPEQFMLAGFSMGGYVAREMVRLAPQRVSSLVLIATSARGDGEIQARRRAAAAAFDPATFRGLSPSSLRASVHPDRENDVELIERIHAMSVRLGGKVFQQQTMFRRDGDLERLGEIRCATLIVAGTRDRLRSIAEVEELRDGIPGAVMELIEAGHMIPMEAPEELAAILKRWLEGRLAQ